MQPYSGTINKQSEQSIEMNHLISNINITTQDINYKRNEKISTQY